MNAVAKCELCGEPMPEGEEMFVYHGYSGACPRPPVPKPEKVIVEYVCRDDPVGALWIDIDVNGKPHNSIGPFASPNERKNAFDDLLSMMRASGAVGGGRA
jgi:hypothetical protein